MIRNTPAPVQAAVVCEALLNSTPKELMPEHLLIERADAPILALLDRVSRKLGSPRLSYLERVLASGRAQILHSHFGNWAWRNMPAARRARVRHVVSFYGYEATYLIKQQPQWRDRYREMFLETDLVICEMPQMAEVVVSLGAPEGRVRVNHLGVEVSQIKYVPRSWDGRGKLRVMIAGSFREKKGIPYALMALAKARESVPLEVTLIGDASDSVRDQLVKAEILETIRQHGLKDVVKLLGYVPYTTMLDEAYRHHIFLAPSVTASDGDTEGGGLMVLVDMAASGMPIISSVHCGIPEVVIHGVTGLLAPERDVAALAAYIQYLAGHVESWRPMLDAGRLRMEQEFNAEIQGIRLAEIYRQLLGS
jgi:colanic acid/amylovoran biosynthesis glycosyltransferase